MILHSRSDPSFRQSSKSLLERELFKRMDVGYRSRAPLATPRHLSIYPPRLPSGLFLTGFFPAYLSLFCCVSPWQVATIDRSNFSVEVVVSTEAVSLKVCTSVPTSFLAAH